MKSIVNINNNQKKVFKSKNFNENMQKGVAYIILSVFSIITLYPILWLVFGSLKSSGELFNNVWGFPREIVWSNYVEAWNIGTIGTRIGNSIFVTFSSLIFLLLVVTISAYALARLEFPGRRIIFYIILGTLMVPAQVKVVPLFLLIRDLGLLNQRLGLILVYTSIGTPFSIFLLRAFFMNIPHELEDAGLIDGANRFQVFFYIVLPIARPGLATIMIFQGMSIWNEFFLASILVRDAKLQTIPPGLSNFFHVYHVDWTLYFAALSIVTIPILILYVIMQKQFIAGLSAGALKG